MLVKHNSIFCAIYFMLAPLRIAQIGWVISVVLFVHACLLRHAGAVTFFLKTFIRLTFSLQSKIRHLMQSKWLVVYFTDWFYNLFGSSNSTVVEHSTLHPKI
jgi:hypothetical protein